MKNKVQLLRLIAVFLLPLVLPSFLSASSTMDLIILLDLSESFSPVFEEAKKEIDNILFALPDDTCVQIISITDSSFSSPKSILFHKCIPTREYILDSKPLEARRHIQNEWKQKSDSLRADRKYTDFFGAIAFAALLFSEDIEDSKERLLLIYSDGRHNARGIDIETVPQIPLSNLSDIQARSLQPRLVEVKVLILGAHTFGKNEIYYESLKKFLQKYFEETGASLKTFSPDVKWSPGNIFSHK